MRRMILSILVDNTAGVLSRVAGLFSRRGYNIDSLTVGETEDPEFSRMTVAVTGDDDILEQIEKQLAKLEDVRHAINAIVDIFRAKIVDVASDSMMIELTGNQAKLDAFIQLLDGYEIKEFVRTGLAGLVRGSYDNTDCID